MTYRVVITANAMGDLRSYLFGRRGSSVFRALFTIAEDEVRVLHIRRAVMDTATPEEFYG